MRRLAHFRNNQGTTIWDGARYITPLRARTIQLHAVPENVYPSEVTRQTQLGTDYTPAHYTATAEYPVSQPVISSLFISDPHIFQSYFKVRWEGMFGARANLSEGTRRMTPLANRNAQGKAEGQAIMGYNPWPSASQLAPQYPGAEVKAL